jgi:hypothetical protein
MMATLADHPFSLYALSPFSTSGLCPLVLGHKGGEPEAILPKIALLPLSHPATLQPPIGDEPPPRRSPMTPPASHPAPAPHPSPTLTLTPTRSTPLGTQASTASQPLQPRQCTPGDTALVTQWPVAALADRGARASPCSACVRARPGRGIGVPRCAHFHFSRAAPHSARHRACNAAHASPCMPMPRTPWPRPEPNPPELKPTPTRPLLHAAELYTCTTGLTPGCRPRPPPATPNRVRRTTTLDRAHATV